MPPSSPFGQRVEPSAPTGPAQSDHPTAAPISDASPSLTDLALGLANPRLVQWAGYGLCGLGFLLAMVELFRPSMPLAALLLFVPLAVLALALFSPASFEAGRTRRTTNGAICLPFVALFLVNLFHAQINPFWPLIPAAIGAVVALDLAWGARNRPDLASPRTFLAVMTLCGAAYGYGAVAVVDIRFDTSPGSVIPVQVLGKHETYSRRSNSYYLELPAWGPKPQPGSVEVSSATYQALQTGDTVCMVLHPGVLGLPWFTAGVCARPAPGGVSKT